MKITKEQFLRLMDENISHKEYTNTMSNILCRITEIVRNIKHDVYYFYCNEDMDFNPETSTENITLDISLSQPYGYSLPTRWLWEDDYKKEYETAVKEHNELKIKEKAEKDRKALEEKQIKVRQTVDDYNLSLPIVAKLSVDEMFAIRTTFANTDLFMKLAVEKILTENQLTDQKEASRFIMTQTILNTYEPKYIYTLIGTILNKGK